MKNIRVFFILTFLIRTHLLQGQQVYVDRCIQSDTVYSRNTCKWENGKTKTSYKRLNDSTLIRSDFYESGNLKCKFEAKYLWTIDTCVIEDVYSPGTFIYKTAGGYIDIPHGQYIEYMDVKNDIIKVEGRFKDNLQIGEWKFYNDGKAIYNYDNKGRLNGNYIEYFHTGAVKWKGQYSVVKSNQYIKNYFDNTDKLVTVEIGTKTGVWYHYDLNGIIIETVTYDWKLK